MTAYKLAPCPNCKMPIQVNANGSAFCNTCNLFFDFAPKSPPPLPPRSHAAPAPSPPTKKNKLGFAALVVVGIWFSCLVLGVVMTAVFPPMILIVVPLCGLATAAMIAALITIGVLAFIRAT